MILNKWGRMLFGAVSLFITAICAVVFWKTGAALSSYNFFDDLHDHGRLATFVAALIGIISFAIGMAGIAFLRSKKLGWVLMASIALFIGTTPFLGMMAREATK